MSLVVFDFYSLYYPLPITQVFVACPTGSIQVQQVQALKYQIHPLACASPSKVNTVRVGKMYRTAQYIDATTI
jgi:hypothetical protein